MSLNIFIQNYLDDYVIMAYRRLTGKVNFKKERMLVHHLYYLLDLYAEGELADFIHYNKIV